jgi:hypothetical protein
MDDKCPFCKRAYGFYCHQYCKETKKLIDKFKEGYNKLTVPDLSTIEIEFIIDALETLYEGGEG